MRALLISVVSFKRSLRNVHAAAFGKRLCRRSMSSVREEDTPHLGKQVSLATPHLDETGDACKVTTSWNAKSVFESLIGSKWNFKRTLLVNDEVSIGGTVCGTASFTSEFNRCFDNEKDFFGESDKLLLYSESGIFQTDKGERLNVHREYVYTYNDGDQSVRVHFAQQQYATNGSSVTKIGSLFHTLVINSALVSDTLQRCTATPHLCGQDMYRTIYSFSMSVLDGKLILPQFSLYYDVRGPKKRYSSETTYERFC